MQFNKYTHTHTHTDKEREKKRERHEALRQAHLPIREGSVGVNSSNASKSAAYIGRHALVLGHVVAASAQGGLPSFLERLPEQPMASSLLEELKTMATEVKRSQIEDAVGSSWGSLAVEDDSQTGAGGGRTGAGERGGAGVLNSKNNGSIRWQPQPDRDNELSRTNRGVREVCVRVVPRVQSKLSRALRAHRGKKLLQDVPNLKSTAMKKGMIRFRGAREKVAMAFVECLRVSREDMMKAPL